MMVTETQSYLCGSVPVRKTGSKLPDWFRGGRRQCGPAMGRSVEAGPRHFEGLHLGLNDVRVPIPAAKHGSPSPRRFMERHRRLPSPVIIWVTHAITWRKGQFIFTDEVSRRLRPQGGVRLTYKAWPKRLAYAPVWRRFSQQPPLQRWQQIGSSSSLLGGVKRETTEKVVG